MNDISTPATVVITIGRQMGSGGRLLGRLLADRLGIAYYDKELLLEAARRSGLSPEFCTAADERSPKFFGSAIGFAMGGYPYSVFTCGSMSGDDAVNKAVGDIIRSVANERSCVIVGRTADYVLRDHPGRVSLFVHAPLADRVTRLIGRGDSLTHQEAQRLAERTDKLRASYYNFFTDQQWGHASTYDMTFNSSLLPMEQIAALVADYVRARFPGAALQ